MSLPTRALASVLVALALGFTGATAQSIRVSFDAAGEVCSGDIPTGVPTTLYVVARLEGTIAAGIAAAELQVEGFPAGWVVKPTLDPAARAIGSPVQGGAALAFAQCQQDPVVLYTLQVTVPAGSELADVELRVTSRSPPGNLEFACPAVALCDYPEFTKVCVSGGRARINPTGTVECPDPATNVPGTRGTLALSVRTLSPSAGLVVALSLPRREPARLEILDVSGRRLLARDVSPGSGSHVLQLARQGELAAGIYVVRLVQGDEAATAKAVILR